MTLDKWIPFRNEGPVVRCRLFCFSARWRQCRVLPAVTALYASGSGFLSRELPGRAARLDELPLKSMSALMERLSRALQPLMGVPFGFLATAWAPLWPLKPPGNYARSMAETAAMSSRRCRLQA
jgi:hypothetical protein